MNIDRLFTLSSKELDDYLEEEVSKIIEAAAPEKRSLLRATHNRARLQVEAAANPVDAMIRTNTIMMDQFRKLDKALERFRK